MDDALRRAVELFNAGEYFECHEVLEEAWLRAAEPRKTFLKGLIHAAVALHHYSRGNSHGARVKYGSATRYLAAYQPQHAGVDLCALQAQMDEFVAPLLAQERGVRPPAPQGAWPVIRWVSEQGRSPVEE